MMSMKTVLWVKKYAKFNVYRCRCLKLGNREYVIRSSSFPTETMLLFQACPHIVKKDDKQQNSTKSITFLSKGKLLITEQMGRMSLKNFDLFVNVRNAFSITIGRITKEYSDIAFSWLLSVLHLA